LKGGHKFPEESTAPTTTANGEDKRTGIPVDDDLKEGKEYLIIIRKKRWSPTTYRKIILIFSPKTPKGKERNNTTENRYMERKKISVSEEKGGVRLYHQRSHDIISSVGKKKKNTTKNQKKKKKKKPRSPKKKKTIIHHLGGKKARVVRCMEKRGDCSGGGCCTERKGREISGISGVEREVVSFSMGRIYCQTYL